MAGLFKKQNKPRINSKRSTGRSATQKRALIRCDRVFANIIFKIETETHEKNYLFSFLHHTACNVFFNIKRYTSQ
jgi:hypothetical protein